LRNARLTELENELSKVTATIRNNWRCVWEKR